MPIIEGIKSMIDRQRELGKQEEQSKIRESELLFEERARVHIFILGKVQGVSFRSFVKNKAIMLGITGFVKNVRDESIEIVGEGRKQTLELFVNECKLGPSEAIIKKINVKWLKYAGEFNDFSVTHE